MENVENSTNINNNQLSELSDRFIELDNSIEWGELTDLDHRILRIHLINPEMKQKDIGKIIGYTRSWVNERMNRPVFKKAAQEITKRSTMSAIQKYTYDQNAAVEELRRLLKNSDPKIRLGAAKLYVQGMIVNKHLLLGDKENPIEMKGEIYVSEEDRKIFELAIKEVYKLKNWQDAPKLS